MLTPIKDVSKKILVSKTEPFLPHELYFEILGWLSVEDLLRCKSVCKDWFQMIQDREFIEMHLNRADFCFVHTSDDGTRGSDVVDLKFMILDHCEGLLVELCLSSQELRIRNPATRKIFDLPYPSHDTSHIFIFYVPSTGSYKLVSTCLGKKPSLEALEIGNGNLVWKRLGIFDQYVQDGVRRKFEARKINRGLYFIRLLEDGSGETEILSMDVDEEILIRCKVPKGLLSDSHRLMSWNTKLSVAGIVGEELHVWVLEDYKMQRWADSKIIIPLPFLKIDIPMEDKLCLKPGSVEGSTIWFWVNKGKLFTYNITSHRIKNVICAPEGEVFVCSYYPSLVALKGMRAHEKDPTTEVEQSLLDP